MSINQKTRLYIAANDLAKLLSRTEINEHEFSQKLAALCFELRAAYSVKVFTDTRTAEVHPALA